MAKIKPLKQSFIISVLKRNGFKQVHSGKHISFKRCLENGEVLTTWVPHHKEISIFVINYLIKQTRKGKDEFW